MTKKLQGRILGCRSRFNFPAEEALVLVDVMARIGDWDGVTAGPVDIVGSRRLVEVGGLVAALELRLSSGKSTNSGLSFRRVWEQMSVALPDIVEKRVRVQL